MPRKREHLGLCLFGRSAAERRALQETNREDSPSRQSARACTPSCCPAHVLVPTTRSGPADLCPARETPTPVWRRNLAVRPPQRLKSKCKDQLQGFSRRLPGCLNAIEPVYSFGPEFVARILRMIALRHGIN